MSPKVGKKNFTDGNRMTDARPCFLTRAFFISKVNYMRLKYEDIVGETNKKEEIKEVVFKKVIVLSSSEAKKNIMYKDSEGNCSLIIDDKEEEGVIITLSSKGDLTIGIKEV